MYLLKPTHTLPRKKVINIYWRKAEEKALIPFYGLMASWGLYFVVQLIECERWIIKSGISLEPIIAFTQTLNLSLRPHILQLF
jgi:hypothetical protein